MRRIFFTCFAISCLLLVACTRSAVDVGGLEPGTGGAVPSSSGGTGGGSVTVASGGTGGGYRTATELPCGAVDPNPFCGGAGGTAAGGAGGVGGVSDPIIVLGGAGGAAGAGGNVITPGNMGDTCNLGVLAPSQGAFSISAPDCDSSLCLKPVDQVGGADTAAFCSQGCTTDANCAGLLRDPKNPSDKRCVSGFTCGVAFVKGLLCCQPVCICKDFTGGPVPLPIACQGSGALTCQ